MMSLAVTRDSKSGELETGSPIMKDGGSRSTGMVSSASHTSIDDKVAVANERIEKAIADYKPVAVFGLFSGGHDSLTATSVARPYMNTALHVNTGIGIEDTRRFVRKTCEGWGCPLREYCAKDEGQDYRELVLGLDMPGRSGGFPGPFMHKKMYNRLKERGLEHAIRDVKTGARDKVLLISGIRAEESERRMGYTAECQEKGAQVWLAPLIDWTKQDCHDYMADRGLERNEVVDKIHKSGECLCGAYAKKGELAELAFWFPETARYIRSLEREVFAAGFPWGWEEEPPKWWTESKAGQLFLMEMAKEPPQDFQPLCNKCNAKQSVSA